MPRTPTLNRHLFMLMLKPSVLALVCMLALVWLMQSLRFLDLIINKGLTVPTFLHLTGLLVPSLLTIILPLALLAGACYAFKYMNDENELPALFSAGLSRTRIIKSAVLLGLLGVLLSYANALYFTPAGMNSFKQLQHKIRNTEGHLLLEEGTFNQLSGSIMVYLKSRTGNNHLNNLLVHDTTDPKKPVTWMAKKGTITFSQEGYPRLTLQQGIRQEVTPESSNMLAFAEHTIDIQRQFSTSPKTQRFRNAEERLTPELLSLPPNLSPKQRTQFTAELYKRLLWPLTPLPLILLAAAFLIKPRATRHGVLWPTALASISGMLYIIALLVLFSFTERGITTVLYGQWALPIVVSFICYLVLRKGARYGR